MSAAPLRAPGTAGLVVEEIPDRRRDAALRELVRIGNRMADAEAVDLLLQAEWSMALYQLRHTPGRGR